MIVVDSSALIEFYRPQGNTKVRSFVAQAIAADEVAINGIIQTEIMAFALSQQEFQQLAADFSAFHWLELDKSAFTVASQIGLTLRQAGKTVPATDLIIAASALEAKALLYHVDIHFEWIAQHTSLAQTNLLPSKS